MAEQKACCGDRVRPWGDVSAFAVRVGREPACHRQFSKSFAGGAADNDFSGSANPTAELCTARKKGVASCGEHIRLAKGRCGLDGGRAGHIPVSRFSKLAV